MAEIGHFGTQLVFVTSDKRILTFSDMTQKIGARWSKHVIIGSKPHKEFNGPDDRKATFKMTFDALYGVRPREMLERLERMVEEGAVEYLVIGGRKIGDNRFFIQNISEAWGTIYNRGELERATVTVTMEEYR